MSRYPFFFRRHRRHRSLSRFAALALLLAFPVAAPTAQAAAQIEAQIEARLIPGVPFSSGEAANGESRFVAASPDGRFVAVSSAGNNLTGGSFDPNRADDVYLLDRESGAWDLISRSFAEPGRAGAGESVAEGVSADGRYVLFTSRATDLLALPGSEIDQVYLFDRATRTTLLVSALAGQPDSGAGASSYAVAVAPDGSHAVFSSTAAGLVAGGAGGNERSLFLFDRASGTNRLVTHAAGSPATYGNGQSDFVEISADGRFLLLRSLATDLLAGVADANSTWDTYLYDRDGDLLELISRQPGQSSPALGGFGTDLSADGRYVLLTSHAALQNGMTDANAGAGDCFLFDRQTGGARLVSRSLAAAGTSADAESSCGSFSDDGRYVYFTSRAGNLVGSFTDANGPASPDVYLFDRDSGAVSLVSHAAGNAGRTGNGESAISGLTRTATTADGRFLLYASQANDLEADTTDAAGSLDLFLYDRTLGSSRLASRRGDTAVAGGFRWGLNGLGAGGLAFFSALDPLDPTRPDANGAADAYVFDPATAAVELLSATAEAGTQALGANSAALDGQGRWPLWAGWLYDPLTAASELIGHAAGAPSRPANAPVEAFAVDAAKRFVLLASRASDLVAGVADPGQNHDVFVYDRQLDRAALITHQAGNPAAAANGTSLARFFSADGQRGLFISDATDLVAGVATQGAFQTYAFDRPTGSITLLSHRHDAPLQGSAATTFFNGISSDERFVLLVSEATDLVPNFVDGNGLFGAYDLYLYDRLAARATLISHKAGSPATGGNGSTGSAIAHGDFRYVFFASAARDLVAGQDLPPGTAIYRWDRLTFSTQLLTFLPVCNSGATPSRLEDVSADGRLLLISTYCSRAPGDDNDTFDAYVYDTVAAQFELISHLPGETAAKGSSLGSDLSDDGRRVRYQAWGGDAGYLPFSYDRRTGREIDLRPFVFDGSGDRVSFANIGQISRDGNRMLISSADPRAAQFKSNQDPEVFLVVLEDLFADGFESGGTGAWSLTLP